MRTWIVIFMLTVLPLSSGYVVAAFVDAATLTDDITLHDPNGIFLITGTNDLSIVFELTNEQDFYLHNEQWDPPTWFVGQLVGITDPNQPVQLDITDVNVLTDETVVRLVKSGRVCEVITHAWKSGCSFGPGCAVYHYGSIRHCVICSKEQTQTLSEWK